VALGSYVYLIDQGWCNLASKTVDNNKEVTELESWSGAYHEFGPNWACLGLQTNFWIKVKNWRRSL